MRFVELLFLCAVYSIPYFFGAHWSVGCIPAFLTLWLCQSLQFRIHRRAYARTLDSDHHLLVFQRFSGFVDRDMQWLYVVEDYEAVIVDHAEIGRETHMHVVAVGLFFGLFRVSIGSWPSDEG